MALMFLLVPAFTIWFFLRSVNVHVPSSIIRGYLFFFTFTFLLTVPYGMAWWTVKKGKAFARFWAIVASLEMILMSLSPLILMSLPAAYQKHSATHRLHHFGIFEGLLLALGIAGLLAFARRDAMAQPVIAAKPPRIAGDGTSRLLDGIAWIVGIAGYLWGRHLWVQWGLAHGLIWSSGLSVYLLILAAGLITVVLHESGHVAVGLALGMKLRAFIVGPFHWRIRDGRWKFQFLPAKILSLGGAAGLVPTDPKQSHWREIWMGAAGPLTNLVTGLIVTVAVLTSVGRPYEQYWQLLALVSTLSLITFIVNLIPLRPESHYSDGAQIYQLLRGGPWADLHRVMNLVGSTLVTPLRPRDYDIDAIQRAEISFNEGRQALLLRFFASYYFLDHGMISQACAAFIDAESIYGQSALELPAELHTDFVFGSAFLRRDAADARLWWERMEAKKPTHFGVDYWLAQSALFWIEGRKEEARTAWEKGNQLAQKLPAAGCYEFDRYRYSLLHDCIEKEEINAAS
jgi:hypothetical protein